MSLIELLLALAISAMLLTATMVALSASFKAYGDAAEQASTQAATRMVSMRLLALIRTSTAHGPLLAAPGYSVGIRDPNDGGTAYTATVGPALLSGDTVVSPWLEIIDPQGNHVRVAYLSYTDRNGQALRELWLFTDPGSAAERSQPLLAGVTGAQFTCKRRMNAAGLYVLERATMDLTVTPGADATLSLEHGPPTPARVIASIMPRKVE